mmetsp:Transcript_27901/g.41180  ORF Transcript_27901/g.41180 Transcript_27901/m.41180 type:complete len:725 (+) Transcript_27901:22-2196(+)
MTSMSSDLLLDRLEQNAVDYASKKATTFLASGPNGGKVERSLTYEELMHEVNFIATFLLDNLSPRDCAVLVYPPSLDYMIAFLACLKAGIIAVPVFPPARRDTIAMFSNIVNNCRAKFALTSTTYNHQKKMLNIQAATRKSNWPKDLKWITTNNVNRPSKPSRSLYNAKKDDLAFLQFTSGSTSEPKGVMITHGNLAHNLTIITNELKAADDTVVVSWLPQYHDMGLIGSYLGVLYCGGSGYYLSPLSFLQRPTIWIEAISKYKATHLQAPNFAFSLTARKFNGSKQSEIDLSNVRHVINAAEPVTEEAINAFSEKFSNYGFKTDTMFPTYGLAEHTVFVCSGGKQRLSVDKEQLETHGKVVLIENDQQDGVSRLIGCGYPNNQNVTVRIVNNETLGELPEMQVGEVWVDSDSKAAGYYLKPEASKKDFKAKINAQDNDEYLRTGDLGFMYQKELFICGRLKDLIIVGGRNYYPQDLESTAGTVDSNLRPGCSAAFTIDSSGKTEQVAMVLELREVIKEDDCENLVDRIRSAINQEHSLSLSEIVLIKPKTISKTTSGKIARAWCRKAFLGNTLQVVYRKEFVKNISSMEIETPSPSRALSPDEIAEIRAMDKKEILSKLKEEISKMGGEMEVPTDVPIATLLDSISVSQLKGQLEARYAVKLSDEYLFREGCTLNKLAEVVRLGYAPDDGEGVEGDVVAAVGGDNEGCAQKLGCPPGVMCVIL